MKVFVCPGLKEMKIVRFVEKEAGREFSQTLEVIGINELMSGVVLNDVTITVNKPVKCERVPYVKSSNG